MQIFNIVISTVLIPVSFYFWKKYKDKYSLLILLINIVTIFFSAFSFIDEHLSTILTFFLLFIVSWYVWKRFNEKFFFSMSLIGLASIIIKVYDYYIEENILHLSGLSKFLSSIFLIIIGLVVLIIWIKVSWDNRNKII